MSDELLRRMAEEIAELRARVDALTQQETIRPVAADVGAVAAGTGGAAGRVAVWDSANSVGGDAALTFDSSVNPELSVGTAKIGTVSTVLSINQVVPATAVIDIDPMPQDGTSPALFRFFRFTDTSGGAAFQIFRGNGTSTQNARIGGDGGNTYVCANNGDFGVGNANPAYKLDVSGNINARSGNVYRVNGVQVVAARRTGWTAPTGTATRTAFATSTVTLQQLAERVKALIDDLIAHGLLGS